MIQGKDFVQKLYSTGDNLIDNLLERAFCEGYLGVSFNYGGDESSRVWRKEGQSLESYKQDRIKQAYSDIENSLSEVKRRLRKQVIEDVDDLNKQYEGKSIPEYLVTKPTKRSSSFNRTKKQVGNFIKDHKGAVIGGTLGTAALVGGGIALHKRNKKKKEKK